MKDLTGMKAENIRFALCFLFLVIFVILIILDLRYDGELALPIM